MDTMISTQTYFALLLYYQNVVSFSDILMLANHIHKIHPDIYIELNRDSFQYANQIVPIVVNSERKYIELRDPENHYRNYVKNQFFHDTPDEIFNILEKEILIFSFEPVDIQRKHGFWIVGTKFNFDPKLSTLIKVHFSNGIYMGDIVQCDDGDWVFFPNKNRCGGAWPSYILHEMGDALDRLNEKSRYREALIAQMRSTEAGRLILKGFEERK